MLPTNAFDLQVQVNGDDGTVLQSDCMTVHIKWPRVRIPGSLVVAYRGWVVSRPSIAHPIETGRGSSERGKIVLGPAGGALDGRWCMPVAVSTRRAAGFDGREDEALLVVAASSTVEFYRGVLRASGADDLSLPARRERDQRAIDSGPKPHRVTPR